VIFQIFLLSIILGFLIGFLAGGFMEWDRYYPANKQLRHDLFLAYREAEELREIICASSKPIRRVRK
jgi:hypothetical protein